ncbi:MAG: hypothetical protein MGF17_07265 [Trichodesmium sp. MAG_R04]|nr:hypothetical protein [Trichodesmium sp. MAG_R04]
MASLTIPCCIWILWFEALMINTITHRVVDFIVYILGEGVDKYDSAMLGL